MGEYLAGSLSSMAAQRTIVGSVRGKGLLLGVELVSDPGTRTPFPRELHVQERVVAHAFEKGLLVAGGTGTGRSTAGDHISLTPPFTVSDSECDLIVHLLGESLQEVERELQTPQHDSCAERRTYVKGDR
jgi:adenosylmethionine-8-amino-7-oxononanoate aminotransferase